MALPVEMKGVRFPEAQAVWETAGALNKIRRLGGENGSRGPIMSSLSGLKGLMLRKSIEQHLVHQFSSVQFSSVAQLCPTLCNPTHPSTPGLPVHHQLPEFTQTLVHRVSDAIQPSHPLSSLSPPAPNSSQASESFPMSQLFA